MCVCKLYVSKLYVSKLCVCVQVVCGQVVCEQVVVCDGSGRRRRRTGCRTKNKNPTQRCGEQFEAFELIPGLGMTGSP